MLRFRIPCLPIPHLRSEVRFEVSLPLAPSAGELEADNAGLERENRLIQMRVKELRQRRK